MLHIIKFKMHRLSITTMPKSRRDLTTIQISKETREMLKSLGKKGETYDDIIRRLIELARRVEVDSVRPSIGRNAERDSS